MQDKRDIGSRICTLALAGIFLAGAFFLVHAVYAVGVPASIDVLNATPTVSAVTVNNAAAITLVANATTSVVVNATISDNNGCTDITAGTSTILLYRSGVGSSTCRAGGTNTLNCYVATVFTASSTCSSTSVNTTTTFGVYYFADATDSSSSYSSQNWMATVYFTDPSSTTGNADSSGVALNTLLAIAGATSSVDYGSITAGTNTSSTNQTYAIKNAGNSSTTLNLSGTALTAGTNSIATSSQHYATGTFTFGANEQSLSASAVSVSGFTIPRPPLDVRWANTTPLPRGIEFHSAVVYRGYIYTTGGIDDASPGIVTSTVYFAPISATNSVGAWATTTPLPRGIEEHSAVAYNGFIYTTGGQDDAGTTTSTVYFAPISATNSVGTWATTTALPRAIYLHSAVVWNGYIYTTGGIDSGTGASTSTVYFAPISATNSVGAWATTTPLPRGIEEHSAVAYNGFIYTTGGNDDTSVTSTVYFAPISATNSVGSWATTTFLPRGIMDPSAVVNNGFIYTTGGADSASVTSTVYFAPISATNSVGTWATTTFLPRALRFHSAVVNNGFFYTIGGGDSAGNITSTVSSISAASRNTYWGLTVAGGAAGGAYSGVNTFTAVFNP